MLGNGRLEAKCQDGETRLGQIRGQMRKKVSHFFERAIASGREELERVGEKSWSDVGIERDALGSFFKTSDRSPGGRADELYGRGRKRGEVWGGEES
jgi:hypothetical protein